MTKRLFLLVAVAWFSLLGQAETYTHYSEWMAASEMKRTPHPYNLNFSSWWPQWSYQVGVELDPMLDVYLEYGDTKLWNYLKEYPQTMVQSNGTITGYNYDDFNLDNVRPGHFLFRMYQQAPANKELIALNTLFKQLENQPRTQNGVWWHKEVYHWQVWRDGVFMGMPFYVLAAPTLKPGEETQYYDDAVDQMTTVLRIEVLQLRHIDAQHMRNLLKVDVAVDHHRIGAGGQRAVERADIVVAVVVHHVVGGDEGGHITTRLLRQPGINLPVVALAVSAAYGLIDLVGTAIVSGDDEVPVVVDLIEVAQIVGGGIRRFHDVAPLVDQRVHLEVVAAGR